MTECFPASYNQREYWCFISYRHSDNKEQGRQWASWLHHSLETYEVPEDLVGTTNERGDEIPARIYPVFRDEEELPADADLSEPISRALRNSRFMVVICSTSSSNSKFVEEEVRIFKAAGKSNRVLAMIIRGEPNASEDTGKQRDGFSSDDECFPLSLRRRVDENGWVTGERTEPAAADFRLADGQEGWTSIEAYRQALENAATLRAEIKAKVEDYSERCEKMRLKIIAGILGIPLGILTEREKAYQLQQARKRAQDLRRWLTAVSVVLFLAIGAGTLAAYQWRMANLATQRAVTARAQAEELAEYVIFDKPTGGKHENPVEQLNIAEAAMFYQSERQGDPDLGNKTLTPFELRLRADGLNSEGIRMMENGSFDEAKSCYLKELDIRKRLAATGKDTHEYRRDLCICYKDIALLAMERKRWTEAIGWLRQGFKIMEYLWKHARAIEASRLFYELAPDAIECEICLKKYDAAFKYANSLVDILKDENDEWGNREAFGDANSRLCWAGILCGKFPEALAAGEKAVTLLKPQSPSDVQMNLAHAYLFNGHFDKAKAIYLKYKDQSFEDGRNWNGEVLNDFNKLREADKDRPEMKTIEELLKPHTHE